MREQADFGGESNGQHGQLDVQSLITGKKTNTRDLFFLHLSASFGPVIIVLVCLYIFNALVLCCFFYQLIVLVILPYAFVLHQIDGTIDKRIALMHYLKSLTENERNKDIKAQVNAGIILFFVSYAAVLGGFLFVYDVQRDLVASMRIDLDLSFINIFFLFLLLGITNPILEELFWRVFLPEVTSQYELSTSAAKSVENQQQSQQNTWVEAQIFEKWRLIISLEFGVYHFFVVLYLSELWKALVAMIAIQITGRFFAFLRDRIGVVTAILMHAGYDLAIITMALLMAYYVYKDKELFT